jgi:hypothetical protein
VAGVSDGESLLHGRWQRVSPPPPPLDPESVPFGQDASQFPGEIEFSGVRYRASKAADQAFIVWDVGTFEHTGDRLTMTLANDASASYRVDVRDDELTVTDARGQRTTYQRTQ